MTPKALMVCGAVWRAPATENVVKSLPLGERTYPCAKPLPSKYTPAIAPNELLPAEYDCVKPGGSNVVMVPSGKRTKLCVKPLPSVYSAATSPQSLSPPGKAQPVETDPVGSNVVSLPSGVRMKP